MITHVCKLHYLLCFLLSFSLLALRYSRMQKLFLQRGDALFQAGDLAGQGMWVVIKGALGIYAQVMML
jgi:CRP-like cAMP-binding protein